MLPPLSLSAALVVVVALEAMVIPLEVLGAFGRDGRLLGEEDEGGVGGGGPALLLLPLAPLPPPVTILATTAD